MSKTELSRRAKVGRTTIYLIENEMSNPTVKVAARIAEALDVDVREIFFNDSAQHANQESNSIQQADQQAACLPKTG
jgi:DNA-binding XRE family transcriptional regulator